MAKSKWYGLWKSSKPDKDYYMSGTITISELTESEAYNDKGAFKIFLVENKLYREGTDRPQFQIAISPDRDIDTSDANVPPEVKKKSRKRGRKSVDEKLEEVLIALKRVQEENKDLRNEVREQRKWSKEIQRKN